MVNSRGGISVGRLYWVKRPCGWRRVLVYAGDGFREIATFDSVDGPVSLPWAAFYDEKPPAEKRSRLYDIWNLMKQRCFNERRPDYKWYGGRGISVCECWRLSYKQFEKWALQNGYSGELTIDRLDTDGPYSPENCRWIPFSQQRENTSQSHLVTINGKTQSVKSWCRQFGISHSMVYARIHRGVSVLDALFVPPKVIKRRAVQWRG